MANDNVSESGTPAPAQKRTAPPSLGYTTKDAAKRIEALDLSDILGADDDEVVEDDEDSSRKGTPPSAASKRGSKPTPKPKPKPVQEDEADDEDDEDEQSAAEDDEESDLDEDEDSENVDDEDDESDENESDGPTIDLKRLPKGARVPVKVDGKTKLVPLSEALAGYSRTDSYTKKSQAHAEKVRTDEARIAAKERETVAQAEYYVSQLTALEDALRQDEPDWGKIRAEHPEQFAELHAAWQIHEKEVGKVTAEREAEERKLAAKAVEGRKSVVNAERAKLVALYPEWGDMGDTGKEFRSAVQKFGIAAGFTAEELNGIADHRALATLVKASLYDKLLAEKTAAAKKAKSKVDAVQEQMRSGSKKTTQRTTNRTRQSADMARLKRTGNVRDAAKVLEGMF